MPTSDGLMGLGMSPFLASQMGNQDSIVTCAGTSQATATLIKTHMPEFSAASSQTGAIFNASASVGNPHFLFCSSSTAAVVYPPVGQTINGTLNGSFTLSQNKMAIAIQYKKGFWSTLLTA